MADSQTLHQLHCKFDIATVNKIIVDMRPNYKIKPTFETNSRFIIFVSV